MANRSNHDNIRVAAVCGREVRLFGEVHRSRRPLLTVRTMPTRGAALEFAREYDDRQRGNAREEG
ncbi:MAG: hypothetical protein KF822_09635 [Steroidobacteraceae bacterium]|nr:hypothetical protein [Steroidobacteraceae bacterium]